MSHPEVTPDEAFEALDRYRVVDVREAHEFHGPLGRIEGAMHVPLRQVADRANQLANQGDLLLVCRSGARSGKACAELFGLGCVDVTNLAGGMIAWNRAGLPLERSEPESLADLVDQVVAWAAQVGPHSAVEARALARERLARHAGSAEAPSHGGVEELISWVGESLAAAAPADLDLCLASFRRSLTVL